MEIYHCLDVTLALLEYILYIKLFCKLNNDDDDNHIEYLLYILLDGLCGFTRATLQIPWNFCLF